MRTAEIRVTADKKISLLCQRGRERSVGLETTLLLSVQRFFIVGVAAAQQMCAAAFRITGNKASISDIREAGRDQ